MAKVTTKYNSEFDFELYRNHIIKSIFKLLPLKEENKDWQSYLEGFMSELNGMGVLLNSTEFIVLNAKLEGLFAVETHSLFRKIIFDCIDIVKRLKIE